VALRRRFERCSYAHAYVCGKGAAGARPPVVIPRVSSARTAVSAIGVHAKIPLSLDPFPLQVPKPSLTWCL
jgi:hypothetical protein